MKTIYILLIFVPSICVSQFFELTPKGFKSEEGQDYIVIEVKGLKKELFKKSKLYFTSIYRNPDEVMSIVEGEVINIGGYSSKKIRRNNLHRFDMDYNLIFTFKDGKIRVDAPTIRLTTFTGRTQEMFIYRKKGDLTGSYFGIYGKDGKIRYQKAIDDLNNYFNSYLKEYINEIEEKDNWQYIPQIP